MNKISARTISFLTVCILVFCNIGLAAQKVDKFYVNMPDDLHPTLSKQNRLELIEYHKAGKGDSIANRFENMAYLVSIDTVSNHLIVKNTASTTFEMKTITLNNNVPAIGIIRTVCGSICQSSVEFYDTAWHLLPIQFTMPKAIKWVNEEIYSTSTLDKVWINNILQTSFISLNFDKTKPIIVAKNNSLDFLCETDRDIISPLINNKLLTFKLVGLNWVQEEY